MTKVKSVYPGSDIVNLGQPQGKEFSQIGEGGGTSGLDTIRRMTF